MEKRPAAKIQPAQRDSHDSGPEWNPVSRVIEDIHPGVEMDVPFGPVVLKVKAKSQEDLAAARMVLGIFAGAMSGKPFDAPTAMQVITK